MAIPLARNSIKRQKEVELHSALREIRTALDKSLDLASLIDTRHHLVAGPAPELYDLVADPRESRNVLADERRLYAELARELEAHDRRLVTPAEVDEETRRSMAALGYIGSAAPSEGPLPDPKSQLGVLKDLQAGFALHARKDYEGAIAALRRVLDKSPMMSDAWEFVGASLSKLERKEEAIDAYKKAFETSGGAGHVAASIASLYLELGRLDEAESHVELVMKSQPALAQGLRARIALKRKDYVEAERAARASLDASGDRIGPQVVLGEVLQSSGRLEEALEVCREAARLYAERKVPDPDLIFGLGLLEGKILADLGDAAGAEAAFRREIALFPDDPSAYSHLALLYALIGRGSEVGPTLRAMVEANGGPAGVAEAIRALRALGNDAEASRLLRTALQKYPQDRELAALR
jgi:tetratricopeptide (TPR) repeat protein